MTVFEAIGSYFSMIWNFLGSISTPWGLGSFRDLFLALFFLSLFFGVLHALFGFSASVVGNHAKGIIGSKYSEYVGQKSRELKKRNYDNKQIKNFKKVSREHLGKS